MSGGWNPKLRKTSVLVACVGEFCGVILGSSWESADCELAVLWTRHAFADGAFGGMRDARQCWLPAALSVREKEGSLIYWGAGAAYVAISQGRRL